MKNIIYSAKDGYNTIAEYYDDWKWQKFWKNYEFPIIESWVENLVIGKGLDAGSGTGNNLGLFLDKGHNVTAIDISSSMLDVCKNKYKKFISTGKLNCIELDLLNLFENRKSYDWIICNRVLSNIENIDNVFRVFASIIKDNGECLISDVHPLHCYDQTNMFFENKQIVIETFKHPIKLVDNLAKMNKFKIMEFKELYYADLVKSNTLIEFDYLKDQKSPIFFYYILKKY
jgi:2-polyprenyl-3-methyl-5-hydroxy-6-metoxy-1,4-benzoquinol methylase